MLAKAQRQAIWFNSSERQDLLPGLAGDARKVGGIMWRFGTTPQASRVPKKRTLKLA
jgi:hypothetical protein